MPGIINITLVILMLFLLLLFTIVLLHKGRSQYSNVLLAVYLISQIAGISTALLRYIFPGESEASLILYPVIFTWAPFFYFYIISLLYSDYRIIPSSGWWHFIPSIVVVIIVVLHFQLARQGFVVLSDKSITSRLLNMVFNVQIISYNIAAYLRYRAYNRKLKQEYSIIDESANMWLKTSLFGFMAACLVVQLSRYSLQAGLISAQVSFLSGNITFFLFFNLLFYKAIISPDILIRSHIKEKYKSSALNIQEANKILNSLERYMGEQKPYIDAMLSLKALALQTGINERQLSQVINEHRNQNFFDFINSYRVEYAKQLLSDNVNMRRTMFDIMFDAGFNSKSTFNAAFKKHAGITPSDFKKKKIVTV